MSIEKREAISEEMKKNIRTVKKMTNGMGFDENMGKVNWSMIRRISNFGYQFMTKEKGVKFRKVKNENLTALVSEYGMPDTSNIIMYIHGGGFVSGGAKASKGYSSMLAKYSGNPVYAIEYGLAPEKPFPHGFDDCVKAFDEIVNMYPNAKLTLVGESAGANLCIAVALEKKETKKIACVLVHSPIVDFTGSLDRTKHTVDDFTVKAGCLIPLKEIYVKNAEIDNPYISTLFGDYQDFPPTFITCDSSETLYADAVALYRKCESENVRVKMIEVEGTFHAFATIGTGTPETMKILHENIAFMKECICS
jgi:acetyl esterase/lipase